METALLNHSQASEQNRRFTLAKGTLWSLLGGLAGTLLMDLILMGILVLAGLPATACFSVVGDTVARFFSLLGGQMAGSVALGVITHYVIGPAIGAIFGVILALAPRLQDDSRKRCIVLSVIYVEVLSQPLLLASVLLLDMKWPMIAAWYGGAFVMHFLMGIILGAMVSHGMGLVPKVKHP